MRRPINPQWLLRQADDLGYRGQGRGQPRNANLRRAVSAAYYALYHELVNRACIHQLPRCSEEDRWRLARLFTHASVRQVCDWIIGPGPPPPKVRVALMRLRGNAAVFDIALAFQTLQEARHEADYDHMADFTKPATLTLIDQSRDAIRKLGRISRTADYSRFMAHLAMQRGR